MERGETERKLSFAEKCWLINVEETIQLENLDSSKDHYWMVNHWVEDCRETIYKQGIKVCPTDDLPKGKWVPKEELWGRILTKWLKEASPVTGLPAIIYVLTWCNKKYTTSVLVAFLSQVLNSDRIMRTQLRCAQHSPRRLAWTLPKGQSDERQKRRGNCFKKLKRQAPLFL